MKTVKKIIVILLLILICIQWIPSTQNTSDIIPETDFLKVYDAPTRESTILIISCYDCHSNNTEYPWYSKIQPAAWYLEDHIKEGKDELNFNEWDTYSSRRKNSKLRSIIKQIEGGEMPLESYTLIHGGARLDSTAVKEIIGYMESLQKN